MDEKEVDDSNAVQRRSKSVPAMYPVILNDTQLQDQHLAGRPRSNTTDSAERLVRTQRRGVRLSSGGLIRNQNKKRRNKGLEKSRSVDTVDREERNNPSGKPTNSSESSGIHEEDRTLTKARKQGFCLPGVNRAVQQFKTMESEQEFPNIIDFDTINSSRVVSSMEEGSVDDQELKSTVLLHDEHETSKFSEDETPFYNSHLSEPRNNEKQPKQTEQEQTKICQRDSKINIRRKSLPADWSDYSEGHEHCTGLANIDQTYMEFQNYDGVICKTRCLNNWRRSHSLPEPLHREKEIELCRVHASNRLEDQQTGTGEPVDQKISQSIQGPVQHQQTSCNKSLQGHDTMVDKSFLERQQPSISEENLNIKDKLVASNMPSEIMPWSHSLPEEINNAQVEVEKQDKEITEMTELKCTKSLSGGDEFDEVFPIMLSERNSAKHNTDIYNLNEDLKENVQDGNAIVQVNAKRQKERKHRRRAKSLPVTLALEEIPEESLEQYSHKEYESIEDMATRHINKAFQALLRKIQVGQRPRSQVKRSRSLSTIKEIAVSNETLQGEPCQYFVPLQKTLKQGQEINITKQNTPNEHAQRCEQPDSNHERQAVTEEKDDEESQQICEQSQEQERCTIEIDGLQQENEQDLTNIEGDEQTNQEQDIDPEEENKRLRWEQGKEHEHETFEIQQVNNEEKRIQILIEDDKLYDNTQQQQDNEALNKDMKEEMSVSGRAHELDLGFELGFEHWHLSDINTDVCEIHADVREPKEGSAEYKTITSKTEKQTEELRSPDDEDIQGTILEHINNIAFTFGDNINPTPIVNVISCMERIPEDPDKENALESVETEMLSTEIEMESNEMESEPEITGVDTLDGGEEQPSTLKRAGCTRRKGLRGKIFDSSRKKSWPLTNDNINDQPNREQKRVTFDFPQDTSQDDDLADQEGGFLDQYKQDPSRDVTFLGSASSNTSQEGMIQDDFEDGPKGDIIFVGPGDSDHYETSSYQHPEELEDEQIESKFDVLLRNAINSYLEPDYRQSESPVHQAVALGSIDHVRQLIDEGADVNGLDKHGWPPLHVATLFNYVDCAELLLDAGADLQHYTDLLIHEYQRLRETVC